MGKFLGVSRIKYHEVEKKHVKGHARYSTVGIDIHNRSYHVYHTSIEVETKDAYQSFCKCNVGQSDMLALTDFLKQAEQETGLSIELILLESTGPYSETLYEHLQELWPVCMVNPATFRTFGEKFGTYYDTQTTYDDAKTALEATKDKVGVDKDEAGDGRYLLANTLLSCMATSTDVPDDELEARLAELAKAGWEGKRVYFNEPVGVKELASEEIAGGLNLNWTEREKVDTGSGMSGSPELYYVVVDGVLVQAVTAPRTETFVSLTPGEYTIGVSAANQAGRSNPTHPGID